MFPAKQQGTSIKNTCKFEKEIKERFKDDYKLQKEFFSILRKRELIGEIMGEPVRDYLIRDYIKREYHPEIIENINLIWNGLPITKDMEEKLSTWNKENRSNEEFFLNTVCAWLGEDYHIYMLGLCPWISSKYVISREGTDAQRKITKATETDIGVDIVLINRKTGEKTYLEVMESNTNFVRNTNTLDLRWRNGGKQSKFSDLKKLSEEGNKVTIVVLDNWNKGFLFLNIEDVWVVEHRYWNKYWERYCTKIGFNYDKHFKKFEQLGITA